VQLISRDTPDVNPLRVILLSLDKHDPQASLTVCDLVGPSDDGLVYHPNLTVIYSTHTNCIHASVATVNPSLLSSILITSGLSSIELVQ
jgi:hypothetical protein